MRLVWYKMMINIDSLSIKAFIIENIDFFKDAKVQKIQQPNRKEIILHLRNQKEVRKLYININPSFYHICFMSKDNELKRNIQIPKNAAMFCMLLRKYIEGSRIREVNQPPYERIVEFIFDYYDALGEKTTLCLAVELMGKHSNVVLYNYDTNVIIGCAHNVGSEKSKERELAGTLPYIYPQRHRKCDILKTSFSKFLEKIGNNPELIEENLVSSFYYVTKPIAKSLCENFCYTQQDCRKLYEKLIKYVSLEESKPFISEDFSEFSLAKIGNAVQKNSVNEMLDDYFSYHQSQKIIQNTKHKIFAIINNKIKKLLKLKEQQEFQIEQLNKARLYKKKGDLLMANLYNIQSGVKKIVLTDYETGGNIEIDMDENLSPADNANRYYKLYKKAKTSCEHAGELLKETVYKLRYYKEQNFYVDITDSIQELDEIYAELKDESTDKNKQKKEQEHNIETLDIDGFKVYIGKNNKQNDFILSKLSSSEDIWFHTLNMAGAHVLLKKNNSRESINEETLFKTAKIAKELSAGKNASKVPVIYTLRKYVKKANSKGLAFVTYKNETEILID